MEFCIKGDFEEKTGKAQILKNESALFTRIFFSTVYVISLAVSSLTLFFSITVELQRISGKILHFSHFFLCFGKFFFTFSCIFVFFLSVSRETYANIKYEVPNPITPNNADRYTVKAFNFKTVENTSVHK